MDRDSEWISLKELFDANLKSLPKNFKTLQRLTKKENWKQRESQVKTGGKRGSEYHISSLPLEARVDFMDRLATSSKDSEANILDSSNSSKATKQSKPSKEKDQLDMVTYIEEQEKVAETLSKAEHFGSEVDKRNLEKARAKEQILLNLIEYRVELGVKTGREGLIMEMYTEKYNKGLINNKELYEYIPSLSTKSLWRWKKAYKEGGLKGLLENWETKGRKSIMENKEYLATVLKNIKEQSHVSNRMQYEMFNHKHGRVISYRGFSRWLSEYRVNHKQELTLLTNPDGWKNKYKLSIGKADEQIVRLNQEYKIDSTKADIILSDNRRCNIIGIIDVYSRRAILHISRTSNSEAILGGLLKAFNKWGKPEVIASDNGSDFVNKRVKDSIHALGIKQKICPPFSPEKKPFIERFFKTFSHNMLTMLDGYIGHDVASRKKIESKKSFVARLFRKEETVDLRLNREELQAFCNNWIENYYHNKVHRALGMSPNERVTGYLGEMYN